MGRNFGASEGDRLGSSPAEINVTRLAIVAAGMLGVLELQVAYQARLAVIIFV